MNALDILLHLDSYPDPSPTDAIGQGVAFGASLDGIVTALAIHVEIRVPRNPVAEYLINVSKLAGAEEGKSLETCQRLLADFSTQAKAAGMPGNGLVERANLNMVGEHVALRARTRDLCLVPIVEPLDDQRAVAEAVIFGSGRPAVVFWPALAALPTRGLGTVVLAWDGSRTAARAMADALPVLRKAKKVLVFTAVNEKPAAAHGAGADAVRYLGGRGVAAVAEEADSKHQSIGRTLDAYVRDAGADLLVMGAYGHSKMREFILGGATGHVLSNPKVPVLLSH